MWENLEFARWKIKGWSRVLVHMHTDYRGANIFATPEIFSLAVRANASLKRRQYFWAVRHITSWQLCICTAACWIRSRCSIWARSSLQQDAIWRIAESDKNASWKRLEWHTAHLFTLACLAKCRLEVEVYKGLGHGSCIMHDVVALHLSNAAHVSLKLHTLASLSNSRAAAIARRPRTSV